MPSDRDRPRGGRNRHHAARTWRASVVMMPVPCHAMMRAMLMHGAMMMMDSSLAVMTAMMLAMRGLRRECYGQKNNSR